MYLLFYVLTIIHRFALASLLIAFALVPLLIESSIFTSYIALPTLFILVSVSTLYIENALNKYQKQLTVLTNNNKQKKCLIRYGICCLHY